MNPIGTEHLPLFEAPVLSKRGAVDTSRKAADHIASRAALLRARAYLMIRAAPHGLTADEVADLMGEKIWSIRPRICELHKPPFKAKWPQQIRDSGVRRRNESGDEAAVWIALSEDEVEANRLRSEDRSPDNAA